MTPSPIIEFTAKGSPEQLSHAIAHYVHGKGALHALVVPWESEPGRLSMALTSVASDGWAIEHTNLGTIALSDLGHAQTRVAVIAHESGHPEREKLTDVLRTFARQIQDKFQAPQTA